jgi:hypothetical protein
MYENGKITPVETTLRMGARKIKEMMQVNLTKLYCKHFCKCHNEPPQYNSNMTRKKNFLSNDLGYS